MRPYTTIDDHRRIKGLITLLSCPSSTFRTTVKLTGQESIQSFAVVGLHSASKAFIGLQTANTHLYIARTHPAFVRVRRNNTPLHARSPNADTCIAETRLKQKDIMTRKNSYRKIKNVTSRLARRVATTSSDLYRRPIIIELTYAMMRLTSAPGLRTNLAARIIDVGLGFRTKHEKTT